MRLTVRVPATSANLGPGFDCFGLALDLCNEVTVDTDAEPGVTWEGEGADELPTDGTDMVSRGMRLAADRETAAGRAGALPPVHIHGRNLIPLERGLGSSSAAAVAGVVAGLALLERPMLDDPDLRYSHFAQAAELEGHPDNAAPAVFGGITIVADGYVHRLDPDPRVDPVVLVPDALRLPTDAARRGLPDAVSRRDAVFNVGHAALLAVALTSEPDLLLVALHDRLHEDARLELVPEAREVVDRLRRAQLPTCVSGAGPSLLAFERDGNELPDLGPGWRVLRPGIRAAGAEIVPE